MPLQPIATSEAKAVGSSTCAARSIEQQVQGGSLQRRQYLPPYVVLVVVTGICTMCILSASSGGSDSNCSASNVTTVTLS